MQEHEKWMKFAIQEAEKAFHAKEIPVGAVVVKDGHIIGRGYNQCENLHDPTAHAEIIAISSATNTLKDWRLTDCSLYVTKEPCLMCLGAIVNSRIANLFYGMSDEENGYITNNKFTSNSIHLKYIEGNILEFDSKKIILTISGP